jgi:peptide/nickel transport system permease protein
VFGKGYKYKLWGVLPTTRHILAVNPPDKLYLWGADTQGRDVYSRTVIGSRVSLTIGIVSVLVGTIVAAILGTISGYFGGAADNIIQRIAEIIMSIPTLPLWMVLAAILPKDLSVTQRYLLISLILVVTSWPGLARQVRAKTMTFARADFVNAAKAAGSGTNRIILTHLMPNTVSHLVVVACLGIPGTIAAETSLSFLGIGMQEPAVSWGVLLQAAQDMSVINSFQWILIPGLLVIIAVTMFQLIGDGLRDAVDPYS